MNAPGNIRGSKEDPRRSRWCLEGQSEQRGFTKNTCARARFACQMGIAQDESVVCIV